MLTLTICCRYDVNGYSEVKQSVSRDNTITDSKHVQSTEPEYEAIDDRKLNMKPLCDVKMDANPAYHASDVKMDANPAYHATS